MEIEEPGALVDRRRAGFRHGHGLARGHGGDDEIGFRGQLGVRCRQRNAMRAGMIAQRAALPAVELDVVGRDLDVLLAQILSQDAADLTVTDQSYLPAPGIRHQFNFLVVSSKSSSTA